jgi:hypothetical protein
MGCAKSLAEHLRLPSHLPGPAFDEAKHDLYPLSWEAEASQAKYAGMTRIDPKYVERRLCAPHTWHAAEMFLYLLERSDTPEDSTIEEA